MCNDGPYGICAMMAWETQVFKASIRSLCTIDCTDFGAVSCPSEHWLSVLMCDPFQTSHMLFILFLVGIFVSSSKRDVYDKLGWFIEDE